MRREVDATRGAASSCGSRCAPLPRPGRRHPLLENLGGPWLGKGDRRRGRERRALVGCGACSSSYWVSRLRRKATPVEHHRTRCTIATAAKPCGVNMQWTSRGGFWTESPCHAVTFSDIIAVDWFVLDNARDALAALSQGRRFDLGNWGKRTGLRPCEGRAAPGYPTVGS